jgi:hypothetical protein
MERTSDQRQLAEPLNTLAAPLIWKYGIAAVLGQGCCVRAHTPAADTADGPRSPSPSLTAHNELC